MEYSNNELRNRWVQICQKHEEVLAARAASAMVCYPAIVKSLRQIGRGKRRLLLQEFFEVFPNSKQLAKVMDLLLVLDFANPAPLGKLVKPVNNHLDALGFGRVLVQEVPWSAGGRPVTHSLNKKWAKVYSTLKMGEQMPLGALGRFIQELITEILMPMARTHVGVTAMHEPRTFVLRLAWHLADENPSPWDHLGTVSLLGWIPVGLNAEGDVFFVARLPERDPEPLQH